MRLLAVICFGATKNFRWVHSFPLISDVKDKFVNAILLAVIVKTHDWGGNVSRLRVALVLLGDAMLCVAIVLIVQIDQLVNGTLYSYGLVFNDSWAQPYGLMLKVSLILIVVAIILISVVELPYPAFQEKTEEAEQKEHELTTNKPEETESLTAEEVEEEPVSA